MVNDNFDKKYPDFICSRTYKTEETNSKMTLSKAEKYAQFLADNKYVDVSDDEQDVVKLPKSIYALSNESSNTAM